MAEGGFDYLEMKDFDVGKLEDYSDDQLTESFNDIAGEKDSLYKRYGDNDGTPKDIRVKYDGFETVLDAIEEERDRRSGDGQTETSFIDDGKTVTIEGKGLDPIEVPSARIVTNYKRNITHDKKANIKRVLGLDFQFRIRDGANSKKLLSDTTVVFSSNGNKVIGLEYKKERVYVGGDGKSYRPTTNVKNQASLNEFESVRQKATEEYKKFEKEKQKHNLVEITAGVSGADNIPGLTPKENSELRGVLEPNETIDKTTRSLFLEAQADHFQKTIDETNKILTDKTTGSEKAFELNERIIGLKDARDRTLDQLDREEIREQQEEDISRLQRFKEWAKENMAGLAAIAISIAGVITTVIVSARSVIKKGATATSKFAKAVLKPLRTLLKS